MINTTVDAFGTTVTVGDIVAVIPVDKRKHLVRAKVIKCTPKGATVQIGEHKFNRKSEMMILLEENTSNHMMNHYKLKESLKGIIYENYSLPTDDQVSTKVPLDDSKNEGDNQ